MNYAVYNNTKVFLKAKRDTAHDTFRTRVFSELIIHDKVYYNKCIINKKFIIYYINYYRAYKLLKSINYSYHVFTYYNLQH